MRPATLLAVPILIAGAAVPVTPAGAQIRPTGQAAAFTISGQLTGVAATSAGHAWAVGYTFTRRGNPGKTVIVRWNGTAWRRVPSPSPGTNASLSGVAATSSSNAWAVGYTATSTGSKTLILRWNGSVWKRVPSPVLQSGFVM